jgi:superfamily II DNA or RNA helicase
MNQIKLRPYQIESILQLRDGFAKKHQRQLLALTTGAGKTVVFSEMVRLAANKGTQTLVLTNRIELFSQTFAALERNDLTVQKLNAQTKKEFDQNAMVTVAMVETFKRRKTNSYLPTFIIIDEAHIAAFNKVIDMYPDAKVIGATATPVGKHIYKYYTNIVQPVDTLQLIGEKFLMPCESYQMEDDFSDLKTRAGEYTEESLFAHFNKRQLYSGVIEKWKQKCNGKKTVVFNVNIEHAVQMSEEFNMSGIQSKCITSNTPKTEREKILLDFKNGLFPVLNNCGILTTGWDEPTVECVVMNRKTKSLPLWLQCCGRGSRPSPNTNKSKFYILDFGMNHDEHGLWEEPREWNIKPPKKKKKGEARVKSCKKCQAVVYASVKVCPHCDYEFPIKTKDLVENGSLVLKNYSALKTLKGKRISDCSIQDLLTLEITKKYKPSFIWRVLRSRGIQQIKEYAKIKGYTQGWVYRQTQQIHDYEHTDYRIK